MPNDAWIAAYREALATTPSDEVLLDTLEIWHEDVNQGTLAKADILILVDDTVSMATPISNLKTNFAGLDTALQATFTDGIRYSVWRFKDDPDIVELTSGWDTYANANTQIQTLTAAGGGFAPESGYSAIVDSATELTWAAAGTTKVIILMTDVDSNDDGANQAQAQAAIDDAGAHFVYGGQAIISSGDNTYSGLTPLSTFPDFDDIDTDWDAVIQVVEPTGDPNFYLVKDKKDHTLPLVLSGPTKLFKAAMFKFALPSSGEGGIQELQITIGNTDRAITDFLKKALLSNNKPAHLIYRPYLESDTTQPQMDPPIELFLTDVAITTEAVTGRATFTDLVNRHFPSDLYTRRRFPSLGG